MPRLDKHKILLISGGLLLLVGCSRSPDGPSVRPDLKMATFNPSNAVVIVTNHAKSQVSSQTNVIPLRLDVVKGDDPIYRFMASDLIKTNAKVSAALSESKGMIGSWDITGDDIKSISSELAKIDGFAISPPDGTAVRFDRFVIAVVGGYIGDEYFNAYLIRIPGHEWMFLETRRVPAPLSTRSQ